ATIVACSPHALTESSHFLAECSHFLANAFSFVDRKIYRVDDVPPVAYFLPVFRVIPARRSCDTFGIQIHRREIEKRCQAYRAAYLLDRSIARMVVRVAHGKVEHVALEEFDSVRFLVG